MVGTELGAQAPGLRRQQLVGQVLGLGLKFQAQDRTRGPSSLVGTELEAKDPGLRRNLGAKVCGWDGTWGSGSGLKTLSLIRKAQPWQLSLPAEATWQESLENLCLVHKA